MEEEFEEEDEELEREMLNQQRQEEEEAKRRQRQFQASDDIVMDSENDDGASAVASAAHFPATSTPIPVTASPIRRHPSEPEPAGFEDDDFSSISNMGEMIGQGTAEEGNWFEIVKYDAREFFQMVKALAFREYCTLVVNNEGIRLMVDDSHCQQASAYFKCEQFAEFHLRVVICNLRIPVNVFTEALNMFTSNSAVLRMWYQSEGSPLIVCVEDDGIVVQVAIRTMTLLPMLDFEFTEVEVLAKAILLPISMREILRELDTTAETVVLTFTPNYVSFYTVGGLGKIKVEIPTGSDQLEHLSCRQDRVCFQYRVTLIKRMADCVRLCNKVSLRVDHRGVLSVQLLVSLADQVAFAEFFSLAEDDIYHPDTL